MKGKKKITMIYYMGNRIGIQTWFLLHNKYSGKIFLLCLIVYRGIWWTGRRKNLAGTGNWSYRVCCYKSHPLRSDFGGLGRGRIRQYLNQTNVQTSTGKICKYTHAYFVTVIASLSYFNNNKELNKRINRNANDCQLAIGFSFLFLILLFIIKLFDKIKEKEANVPWHPAAMFAGS